MALKESCNALKALVQGIENGIGTNKSGFSELLAGHRNVYGRFNNICKSKYFCNSSNHVSLANIIWLKDNNKGVLNNSIAIEHGLTFGCLRETNYAAGEKPCPGIDTVNYKDRT